GRVIAVSPTKCEWRSNETRVSPPCENDFRVETVQGLHPEWAGLHPGQPRISPPGTSAGTSSGTSSQLFVPSSGGFQRLKTSSQFERISSFRETLKVEIAGSNPARVTRTSSSKPPIRGGFLVAAATTPTVPPTVFGGALFRHPDQRSHSPRAEGLVAANRAR